MKAKTDDFLQHYQSGDLADFFRLPAGDTEAALKTSRGPERAALCDALEAYAKRFDAPRRVQDNIEHLRHENARVVVTGQQTGLLLGPLYSLSKAVSAINLAGRLSTEAAPVVPVFWLASQDHDTEEVDHSYLLDFDEQLARLELELPAATAAGRIPFDSAWLEQIRHKIKAFKWQATYQDEVLALLERTAARSETYADWFAALLYALLGEAGLIVLDPMQPDIAALFVPQLRRELDAPLASSEAINKAGQSLRSAGFNPQLGRGEEATNLFLEDVSDAGRVRHLLRFDGRTFYTDTGTYTRADLDQMLAADPARLTPAAGLRPITQDALLPTAVMVAGPGELRYLAQLKGVYELHDVAMPLIWPRTSVTVLEPPVRRMLKKFDLSAEDLMNDFEAHKERVLLELNGHAEAFNEALADLETLEKALLEHVRDIDPTLKRTVRRGADRIEETIGRLRGKTARALSKHDDLYTRQFERLRIHLLPSGTPQERLISPFSFFLKFGLKNVMDALLDLPPDGEHEIVF